MVPITKNLIFVFGSNLAGRHGKGAALTAKNTYQAEPGVGKARTGDSYALPTKDEYMRVLPLTRILDYVLEFIDYAINNPDLTFTVTKVGTGLAGYSKEDIAPFFSSAPENCILPDLWRDMYNSKYDFRAVDI